MHSGLLLFLAQGLGVGRIPWAPGTFGSLLGLFWFVLLLQPGSLWLFFGGMMGAILSSVWVCGEAERILQRSDPPSVVLDEIAAVPVCFVGWVGHFFFKNGTVPAPGYFFSPNTWLLTMGVFAAFRFFDVVKPWPVRQSQKLPRGWGVTTDDVLAAVYVNVMTGAAMFIFVR